MKLFYRELGEENAAQGTLIILHGLFGTSDNWFTVGKQLAENYRVWLVDLRNHGQSPHADVFNYAVMAADVRMLMDQEGVSQAHLIGHSMGGKTAMELATSHPQAVASLTVVDIAPKYYPPHHQLILKALNSLPLTQIKSRQEADKAMAELISDFGVRQFLLKNLSRTSQGTYEWKMNLSVIEAQIESVGKALDENARYEGPSLFVDGSRSDYILPEDAALIKQHFPQAQIKHIEGAGHWVHAEKPQEFLAIYQDFLSQLS